MILSIVTILEAGNPKRFRMEMRRSIGRGGDPRATSFGIKRRSPQSAVRRRRAMPGPPCKHESYRHTRNSLTPSADSLNKLLWGYDALAPTRNA